MLGKPLREPQGLSTCLSCYFLWEVNRVVTIPEEPGSFSQQKLNQICSLKTIVGLFFFSLTQGLTLMAEVCAL